MADYFPRFALSEQCFAVGNQRGLKRVMDFEALGECATCGGSLKHGRVEHPMHQRGRVLLVTNVPATVCTQCGESYFKPFVGQFVMDMWRNFFTGEPDQCGVEDYEEFRKYAEEDEQYA